MNGEGSKTPREALLKSVVLVKNLQNSFPCKVGAIRTCLDAIRNDWEENPRLDLQQFPFNELYTQVRTLDDIVRDAYEDDDQKVERSSPEYEEVLNLYHRLDLSNEFITSIKIFEGVEKRFERIDEMLPTQNYAVRDLLSALNTPFISPAVKKKLDAALHRFDRQEYREALRECGDVGELLFVLYKNIFTAAGCESISGDMGLALGHVRKWLTETKEKDKGEYSYAPRSRLEWLLLSLFETLHYLRNSANHPPEIEDRLPEWQRQRREILLQTSEYARLGLCLSFQIALELQALLGHRGNTT